VRVLPKRPLLLWAHFFFPVRHNVEVRSFSRESGQAR
jgi:hypothetical protein